MMVDILSAVRYFTKSLQPNTLPTLYLKKKLCGQIKHRISYKLASSY